MAYNKEEYTSLTMIETAPGYGLLCNDQVILCDTEKYDCVGAIVMKSKNYAVTTVTTGIATINNNLSNFGLGWFNREDYA